jgi:ApaG protein
MSDEITNGIRVQVESTYDEDRSIPADRYYFFSYHVRLSNEGSDTVQLISRIWNITDGDGNEHRVEGPGVVGEQPVLAPGASFEYTSFCPLPTPFGTMHGTYQMKGSDGGTFDAVIAPFSLEVPGIVN